MYSFSSIEERSAVWLVSGKQSGMSILLVGMFVEREAIWLRLKSLVLVIVMK